MKQVKGGVTAAKGFEAASTAAGIKYKDRTDMALVYSQVPCVAAGTFTTNVVKAAPVKWDQQVVKSGAKAQAVVVNSGIANACTGAEGFGYCKDTADAAAKALNISADGVLIGSTGVIGKQIPIDKLTAGIEALAGKKNDTLENGTEAAKAIMTTDTFPKELAVTIEDSNYRRYGKRIRNDPSEYVYDACIYYNRCSDHKGCTSESIKRRCRRYLQHDFCRRRYFYE